MIFGIHWPDVFVAFLGILFEGAPYILLGTIISGLIDAYLPPKLIEKVIPKSAILAIPLCGFLGIFLPVCECAVVPVIRRLVAKGLPLACAVTYMLAAPIVNPVTVLSTLRAFRNKTGWEEGPMMACSRVAIAYSVCLAVGFLINRFRPSQILAPSLNKQIEPAPEDLGDRLDGDLPAIGAPSYSAPALDTFDPQANEPIPGQAKAQSHTDDGGSKVIAAARTAMRDFLDVAIYFSIGALLTGIFVTQFQQSKVELFATGFDPSSMAWGNDAVAVMSMMILAFLLSLCSTSDAFLAAQMTVFTIGSKLSFLVYGPMMDLKLVFMYMSVFKKKVVLALMIGLFVMVGLLGMTWTYCEGIFTKEAPPSIEASP